MHEDKSQLPTEVTQKWCHSKGNKLAGIHIKAAAIKCMLSYVHSEC